MKKSASKKKLARRKVKHSTGDLGLSKFSSAEHKEFEGDEMSCKVQKFVIKFVNKLLITLWHIETTKLYKKNTAGKPNENKNEATDRICPTPGFTAVKNKKKRFRHWLFLGICQRRSSCLVVPIQRLVIVLLQLDIRLTPVRVSRGVCGKKHHSLLNKAPIQSGGGAKPKILLVSVVQSLIFSTL